MQTKCILVIDDNEDDRFFLKRALLKCGVENVEALGTLAEIERFIQARPPFESRKIPGLIFTDLRFHGDGLNLICTLRNTALFDGICIVVFSGSSSPDEEKAAIEAGASAFYLKPNESELFQATIQEIVAKYSR